MKKILVIGASGGVGRAVCKTLHRFELTTWDRNIWDLRFPKKVDKQKLHEFDVIVNCVGYNVGANEGFFGNSTQNQNNQVLVNFTSQLVLFKKYIQEREFGHLIYFTSENILDPISYNLFYTSSKKALQYSASVLSKEFPNFLFTEIRPGKIKSMMLRQNYGSKISDDEIETLYEKSPYLTCEYVADVVLNCVNERYKSVEFINGKAVYDGNL